VTWLGESPAEVAAVQPPLPITVAVVLGPFDETRVRGDAVVQRFAKSLREHDLFQGVMFPVPPGASPSFELQLAATDSAVEPDSNFWKSFFASVLFPFAWAFWLENDYTLELEALLLRRREVIGTYPATAPIRLRYQPYANKLLMDADGVEAAVGGASQSILAALARDAKRLRQEVNR
jgi:hypothetical protein